MKAKLFVLLGALALGLLLAVPQAAQAAPYLAGDDPHEPAAAVQRISTLTVPPYTPFQSITAHIREQYSGSLGSIFAYDAGSFGVDHVSNLVYVPNSGVTCSHDADLMITCNGSISQVQIDFDYTNVTNDYVGPYTWWGYSGASNYEIDYTFQLIFPAPLVYVRAYDIAPTTVTANQVTWVQLNTKRLIGAALFRDPRVNGLFLPLAVK